MHNIKICLQCSFAVARIRNQINQPCTALGLIRKSNIYGDCAQKQLGLAEIKSIPRAYVTNFDESDLSRKLTWDLTIKYIPVILRVMSTGIKFNTFFDDLYCNTQKYLITLLIHTVFNNILYSPKNNDLPKVVPDCEVFTTGWKTLAIDRGVQASSGPQYLVLVNNHWTRVRTNNVALILILLLA